MAGAKKREPKTERVELKLSKSEKARLESAAAGQGKSVSQYIRDALEASYRRPG